MTTTARCRRCARLVEIEPRSAGRYFATHRAEPGGVTCVGSGERALALPRPRARRAEGAGIVTDRVLEDFAALAKRAERVKARRAMEAR